MDKARVSMADTMRHVSAASAPSPLFTFVRWATAFVMAAVFAVTFAVLDGPWFVAGFVFAGIPGGLRASAYLVRRGRGPGLPRLGLGRSVALLGASCALVCVSAGFLGAWTALAFGVVTWFAEFVVAREFVLREGARERPDDGGLAR